MDQPGADGRSDELLTSGRVSFTRRLDQWVADARIQAAADERSRERWLRSVAEQDATFGGVLLDLAERGRPVSIRTSADRRHHGTIEVLGGDFVALRRTSGAEVLIALRGVTVLRAGTTPAIVGERVTTTDLRLVDALGELAADRERVLLLTTAGDGGIAGTLRSVGVDVAVLRADGDPPTPAYVRTDSITEVGLG